ncbi:hypothetical protein EBR43_10065 [bacterium]|nr:hypothetical protein [bacterium]
MNTIEALKNFLQKDKPNQSDFENFFSFLNNNNIGQITGFNRTIDASINDNQFLFLDANDINTFNYPLLFKSSFLTYFKDCTTSDFKKFNLSSPLSSKLGSFITAGEKASYKSLSGNNLLLACSENFENSFSFDFSLSSQPLSALFCFQSKNKNFPVTNTGVQLVSSNNLYDKQGTYAFFLTGENTFLVNTNFPTSSSFRTSFTLTSSAPEFYNYEPVFVFDFKNISNFNSISASLMPVFKTFDAPSFPSAPSTSSMQLSSISGYDIPAENFNPLSSYLASVTASYVWYYAPFYIVPQTKQMFVFLDNFYPYENDTFLKLSLVHFNNYYTNTLTAVSSFEFNSYTSSYASQTAYLSSFFSQASASNTFLVSSYWSNAFFDDFVASLALSSIGAFYFGV